MCAESTLVRVNAHTRKAPVNVQSKRRRATLMRCYLTLLLFITLQLHYAYAQSETSKNLNEIKHSASEVLKNMFAGLAQGDFSKYSRDFAPDMKASQTRETFLALQKKIQTSLGKLKSLNYLGSYSQGGNVINLFKANFTKDKDDVLIKLVMDGRKSNPVVTGFWLDSPALEK